MSEEKRNLEVRRRRGPNHRPDDDKNIRKMIAEIEERLMDSIRPESLDGLNSFERKLVHRHFDHSSSYETRTYRNGERFTLCVYPVANIEKFAQEKAEESLQKGESIDLPPMGSFERYIVHNALKDFSGVETVSSGEGKERHVQIVSKRFGRGLKRIAKKIKLF
ncbi:MAG: R3H domain-containing nucleic acid-binding protein [bacterium]